MSLNQREKIDTINELQQSFRLSGLTVQQIATQLQTKADYVCALLKLDAKRIEDPWILKNFLQDYNQNHSIGTVKFTALKGDYHDYGFLNSAIIERALLN